MPSAARRWHDEAVAWIEWKQSSRGEYIGRNGREAVRFLSRVGQLLEPIGAEITPLRFAEEHLTRLLPQLGRAPKTKRVYLALLSAFLRWRGNDVVARSGIASSFSKEATRRRWLSAEEVNRVMDLAVGTERIVVALEAFQGLRRVEVLRLEQSDLDVEASTPWIRARGKAHRGSVSRDLPMATQVRRELTWFLPLRASWARGAAEVPELLAWRDGDRMRPYSIGSVDRFVRAAACRAGVVASNHDLRRTFGRMLRNRGAELLEIKHLYGHASVAETEYYIGAQQDRMAATIRLLDPPSAGKT